MVFIVELTGGRRISSGPVESGLETLVEIVKGPLPEDLEPKRASLLALVTQAQEVYRTIDAAYDRAGRKRLINYHREALAKAIADDEAAEKRLTDLPTAAADAASAR